jgi:hypothetical protein
MCKTIARSIDLRKAQDFQQFVDSPWVLAQAAASYPPPDDRVFDPPASLFPSTRLCQNVNRVCNSSRRLFALSEKIALPDPAG